MYKNTISNVFNYPLNVMERLFIFYCKEKEFNLKKLIKRIK